DEALDLLPPQRAKTSNFELYQIANEFLRLGEIKRVLDILNRLDTTLREQLRFDLALKFAEGGDFETALKFARELPLQNRYMALFAIASIAEQKGRKELAQKLYLEAQSVAPPLPMRRK
ncbi:MAG: hypothetical protein N3B10_15270, partial [Armatimonadetes bacterium]|nr:hypothetical protein [Armatimonadota bacterium]